MRRLRFGPRLRFGSVQTRLAALFGLMAVGTVGAYGIAYPLHSIGLTFAFLPVLGLGGATLTDRGAIGETWDRALAADRPFLVDAKVDKDIPLVPPHVTIQQALNTARSQLSDGDALAIIANGVRETVGAKARSVLGLPPKD